MYTNCKITTLENRLPPAKRRLLISRILMILATILFIGSISPLVFHLVFLAYRELGYGTLYASMMAFCADWSFSIFYFMTTFILYNKL